MIWKSRKAAKKSNEKVKEEIGKSKGAPIWRNIVLLVGGCLGLAFGSQWLLDATTNIAEDAGVDPFIIGVTILAFGTSVPELAASAIAAYRKETDIAIGNLIGSNIFNILFVVGLTGTVAEMPLKKEVLMFDVWWMLGITAILLPLMVSGGKIHRWKGALLVLAYGTYLFILVS
jgi:cation:H+ antiporter